ncbi:hypothetical protein [Streptomyces sp. NPDC029041]|uniref:hypothetical protein n=1 Tax=Streptomyces sp. NPDC029041 TaxID=3155727 RepID=UPI0033CA85FA
MRGRQPAAAAGLLGVLCVPAHAETRDIGRDTLPANDGDSAAAADRAVARGAGAGRIR